MNFPLLASQFDSVTVLANVFCLEAQIGRSAK